MILMDLPAFTGCGEELLTRVNVAVQPAKVNAILFKEMLIQ